MNGAALHPTTGCVRFDIGGPRSIHGGQGLTGRFAQGSREDERQPDDDLSRSEICERRHPHVVNEGENRTVDRLLF